MATQKTNTLMLTGFVALALATASLVITVPSLASAIFAKGLNDQSGQDNLQAFLASHDEDLENYLDRFDGRSLFFRPSPPPKPRAKPKPTNIIKEDPKPIGPPPTYTGPKLLGVYGNVVWFVSNLKIPLDSELNGVKVLQINAPWTVKLGHAGGEYDVPIFSDRLINSDEFSNPLDLKSTPGIIYDEDSDDSETSGDKRKRERVQQ